MEREKVTLFSDRTSNYIGLIHESTILPEVVIKIEAITANPML